MWQPPECRLRVRAIIGDGLVSEGFYYTCDVHQKSVGKRRETWDLASADANSHEEIVKAGLYRKKLGLKIEKRITLGLFVAIDLYLLYRYFRREV